MFGANKTKIITDENKIDEVLTRGVEEVIVKEHLKERFCSGEKLRIKLGIDPTASDLHLGHAVPLRKLKQFQDLGHQIIFLIGDFTAKIGDPSGRDDARKVLSEKEVEENMKNYQKQAGKILDMKKVEIRYNSEWYKNLGYNFLFELTSKFTIARILERDDFKKRIKDDIDISMLEILYPLLQGYDSVALDADVEIGGTDQKFNLLMGRKVQRRYGKPEQDILTVPLLEGLDGVNKMSKSLNNYIGINEDSDNMFGKTMSISDSLVRKYFRLLTDLQEDEIDGMRKKVGMDFNPKNIKIKLAKEIVKMYHGEKEAKKAQENFERTFSKREFPEDAKVLKVLKTDKLIDVLVDNKIVESKSEFRRLILAGAVSDFPNKKISDSNEAVGGSERKIKVGKRVFVVLRLK
ncbi:MAG: tyrosine--tRNA ligase [Candidatus Zambryskibacteria bacterium CG10_big_fil_rev_8_21_14_0_10_34_34]|uniref:Tyrosine--tRNA ligase n=1 Tax=Candidatus Zambryskibacteria bacterium CG10_big_fil_rev_8_21_14_0_10_34_34 TaxID=1975114 RepID=A0A2H0R2T8_9BACT|nr:MAG: tyrosine--tRNA ligase [Candidatus Zambryskibacteria bacterium CG10_big_fil_rev_8_21_14_0_10_34_34]